EEAEHKAGFISTLAAALGFAASNDEPPPEPAVELDYRDLWQRFTQASEAEIPSNDQELMDVLVAALGLARDEWSDTIQLRIERLEVADDVPAIDLSVTHGGSNSSGLTFDSRVFLCNRPTQGGGLKRQLDKVLGNMSGRASFMLRASDFLPNRKNQTAQAFRKFRDGGGRSLLVPIPDWERMLMVREFHAHHRYDPGFGRWFEQARLLSGMIPIVQLLRLDLLSRPAGSQPAPAGVAPSAGAQAPATPPAARSLTSALEAVGTGAALHPGRPPPLPPSPGAVGGARPPVFAPPITEKPPRSRWAACCGWAPTTPPEPLPANDDELPLSVSLDEGGDDAKSIYAG